MHTESSIFDFKNLLSWFIYDPYCPIKCNKHYCHHSCLLEWLQKHNTTCPFCRRTYEQNEINKLKSFTSPPGQKLFNFLCIIFDFTMRLMSYFGKILILIWRRISISQVTNIMEQIYQHTILKAVEKINSIWESRLTLPIHTIFGSGQNMFEKLYEYTVTDPEHIHAISTGSRKNIRLQKNDTFRTMKNIHQTKKVRAELIVESKEQYVEITFEKQDSVQLKNYEYIIAKKQWKRAATKLVEVEGPLLLFVWFLWNAALIFLILIDLWIFSDQPMKCFAIAIYLCFTWTWHTNKVIQGTEDFIDHKKGWVWRYIYHKLKPVRIVSDDKWQVLNTRLIQ